MTDRTARVAVRALIGLGTVSSLMLGGAALADTPSTWPKAPPVTALDWALVLLIIPGGLAILIALVVGLATRGSGKYNAGQPWQGDNEWFGGPSEGTDRTVGGHEQGTTGGAGAGF